MPSSSYKETFIKKSIEKHGTLYDYSLVDYKNSYTKVKIICKYHGVFLQAPSMHSIHGNGCPVCGRVSAKNKITDILDSYIAKARNVHGNKYTYTKLYSDANQKLIDIVCSVHGSFTQSASNHISGHKCPQCSYSVNGEKSRLTTEEYIKKANEIHNNVYEYTKTNYLTSNDRITITCKKHGDFEMIAKWHTNNSYGCPACGCSGTSKLETKFASWLTEWNVQYISRKKIHGIEVDFYIPTLNLAFEIDGLFWHSELMGKTRNYHINKTNTCLAQGIKLVHIFENEFQKIDLLKSKVKNMLNLSIQSKIHARQCTVNVITNPKQKNEFLEKNHLHGKDNSSIWLGLYKEDILVALMTFAKKRKCFGYNNSNGFEMVRYCTDINYKVNGGAGKLLKYFEGKYTPESISTFADIRWSTGGLYMKLGFTQKHTSKPSYWYFQRKDKLYHRFNFRKHILHKKLEIFNPLLSEWENMKANGYNRIWDCGNIVFEKICN